MNITIGLKAAALAGLMLAASETVGAKVFKVASPDGKINVEVKADDALSFQVAYEGQQVLAPSNIGMTAEGKYKMQVKGDKAKSSSRHIEETIDAPFYRQKSFVAECNELTVKLNKSWGVVFRAYDEGIAYRFYSKQKGEMIVVDETAEYAFGADKEIWLAYSTNDENPFAMAFQNYYSNCKVGEAEDKLAFLPVTVQSGAVKLTILESELKSYPGMFLKKSDGGVMKGVFAPYPKKMGKYSWRGMTYVAETEDFIAKTSGAREFPWRIIAVSDKDTEMPVNNLVYALSEPNKIGDTSWIKPGKVAWDWWNDWNLKGVDFVAGINTETYKYYIDFASKNKIPYVVLDEGWYDSAKGDIMNPIKELDLEGLIGYAKEKNVDIVLWTVFNVLDEHCEEAMTKYAAMGVKGFKIDFMDRDDQTATEMVYRLAEAAAKHKLFVDYHGYYKPTGMSRTYPNILNYEGVFGMEEARWTKAESNMPLYDVIFPYIRMMAGNVDFTPGALRNGTKHNWAAIYTAPVSMGTRCHQLACYVVHDSPFTMLCDAPTNYEREQECTDLITSIPDYFDRTIIPQGEMGKYIVTAREKDGNWYVGGQTNWDSRQISLPLDFLDEGKTYNAVIFKDGVNANHNAEDYKVVEQEVTSQSTIDINMAEGGGFVLVISD